MYNWSSIRRKLEEEYLALSLRGRIQYFVTRYKKSHDEEGRAAILLDGKEVLRGNYYNRLIKFYSFPIDEEYFKRIISDYSYMDEFALESGRFDQRSFYSAFKEFDNQSIEDSLKSDNLLVRIFAVLDRRIGKRRLVKMSYEIEKEPEIFQFFFKVRADAEHI
ncbi:MAG: hypothetical protein ACI4HN_09250 [Ruminococcus sp.]